MKGFALRLVLNQRHKRTRKWPILFLHKPSHTPRILSFGSLTRTASHMQNWWVFYFVNMTDSWLTMAACIGIWSEGNRCNNTSRTFFSWFRSKLVGFWPGYYFVACERRRISGCHWFCSVMLSLRSTNNNNIFYLSTVGFKVNIAYGAVYFWRFEYSQTTRKLFRDSIIATYLCIRANQRDDSQFNRLRDGSKVRGSLVSTALYKQQEEWSQPSRLQINLKYFASLEEEAFFPHFGYSTGKTNG